MNTRNNPESFPRAFGEFRSLILGRAEKLFNPLLEFIADRIEQRSIVLQIKSLIPQSDHYVAHGLLKRVKRLPSVKREAFLLAVKKRCEKGQDIKTASFIAFQLLKDNLL